MVMTGAGSDEALDLAYKRTFRMSAMGQELT